MTQCIELSEGDYGYDIVVTLYRNDDSAVAENLASVSKVSLDITRLDETPIVQDASVTIEDNSGVVSFKPTSTWFTNTVLGERNHYMAIFKLYYATGKKSSFKIPVYIHKH